MRRLALLLPAVLVSACGFQPGRLFERRADIEVREVARSLYCNTGSEDARVTLLAGPQAVLDWQAGRNLALAGSESLPQAPYALVEMGLRPTGGYGLAVARAAVLRGETVVLSATFVSPAPGGIRTQALSSPCVLVQLPAGRYAFVEVRDQTGGIRTSSDRPEPPPPAPVGEDPPTAPADAPAAETPAQ
jgi:hypothetical protein